MPQNIATLTLSVTAAGTVTACRGVGFDGAQIAAQGAKPLGVAAFDAVVGEEVAVVVAGTATVMAGAAIAKGDSLILDAQGRAIPSTGALSLAAGATAVTSSAANGAILAGGDSPEFVFADALEAASGAGKYLEVLLRR